MNYGYVNKGDRIRQASASRYRDVTRLLNRLERPLDQQENLSNSNVEIMIVNTTDEPLPVYSPVEITEVLEALTDNTVNRPVFQVKEANSDSGHLAITQEYLPVNGIGSALVIGVTPAKVKINSEADQYAAVAPDGTLTSTSDGLLRILACNKATDWAWLQLGGNEEHSGYSGPFAVNLFYDSEDNPKLEVNAGWATVNGIFFEVKQKKINPEDGYLCVYADVKMDSIEIPAPEIKFGTPGINYYPIARITKYGESQKISWGVEQYYSQVAVFQIVKPCPLAEL